MTELIKPENFFYKEILMNLIEQGYKEKAIAFAMAWQTTGRLYVGYKEPRSKLIEHLFNIKW